MQVDPIKPTLKPPGTKRLKLKCDSMVSTSAFDFNLRHYIKEDDDGQTLRDAVACLCCSGTIEIIPGGPTPVGPIIVDGVELNERVALAGVFSVLCVPYRAVPQGGRYNPENLDGRSVQVEHMKPMLKVPGTERLKL